MNCEVLAAPLALYVVGEGAIAGVGFHLLEHISTVGIEYLWCHKVLRYVLPHGIFSGKEFECNHWAAC